MDIATIMKQLHLFRASSANILNYFLPMTDKPVNQIKLQENTNILQEQLNQCREPEFG